MNTFLEEAEQHRLCRLERLMMMQDLVIIDEVGFVPFSRQGVNTLFTFFSQLYLQGSLLVATDLAFTDRGEVFGDPLSVGPLLDRLTHRCHFVQFSGDSYRFRQSLERKQELAQVSRDSIGDLAETGSERAA